MGTTFGDRPEGVVLEAIAELEGTRGADVDAISGRTGMTADEVATAVRRLVEAGYLSAVDASSLAGADFIAIRLRERGLREVGDWPTEGELFAALVAALSDVAEAVDDEDQRGRLQRAGAALGGVSRDVMVQVAAELASKGIVLGL